MQKQYYRTFHTHIVRRLKSLTSTFMVRFGIIDIEKMNQQEIPNQKNTPTKTIQKTNISSPQRNKKTSRRVVKGVASRSVSEASFNARSRASADVHHFLED